MEFRRSTMPARHPARPPFDPELATALPGIHEAMPPGVTAAMIPGLRAVMDGASPTVEALAQDGAFSIVERRVPGPAGAPDVTLLVARPRDLRGPAPIVLHTHGGGMVMGDHRTGLETVLTWAAELGLVVVSVDYRLAPEHPFPAGVEDSYAGLLWAAEHADEIGGDAARILLAGASSGGGLAAALALLARDRGDVRPIAQLLMYPMLDDRGTGASVQQMAGVGVWDATANETGWTALLGASRGGPEVSPYAAPARAADLSGLPPAFLDVGTAETFRDEVLEYGARIARAGGEVELHLWPGAFHAFDFWVPDARVSQDATRARVQWLRRVLEAPTTPDAPPSA
jgi:acetyl esterase/lipase